MSVFKLLGVGIFTLSLMLYSMFVQSDQGYNVFVVDNWQNRFADTLGTGLYMAIFGLAFLIMAGVQNYKERKLRCKVCSKIIRKHVSMCFHCAGALKQFIASQTEPLSPARMKEIIASGELYKQLRAIRALEAIKSGSRAELNKILK